MANQRFTDLPAGTPVGTDVFAAVDMAADVSKQYTRSQQVNFSLNAMGLTTYEAALVATTGALTVAYDNGASGVGATITNAGAQAALSIDGVTMAVSDRVLVKDQATAAENGVYTVTDIGSGATNWVMTRATDYDQAADVVQYGVLLSDTGTTNAGLLWQETGPGPFTMGTTNIVFTQFVVNSAAGAAGGSDTEIQYNNAGALDGDLGFTTDGAGALSAVSLSLTTPLPVTSGGTALSSTTANQLLYSSATSTIAGLPTANNGMLVTSAAGVPSISTTMPASMVASSPFYIGSQNKTYAGPLPQSGASFGSTITFSFTFSDSYGAALIELLLCGGVGQNGMAKYTFAISCAADSGTTTAMLGNDELVFSSSFANFVFADSGSMNRTFTVSTTRQNTNNWVTGYSSYSLNITNGIGTVTLNSIVVS